MCVPKQNSGELNRSLSKMCKHKFFYVPFFNSAVDELVT